MATTNIQSFAGDVEVSGELTVTGQLNSTTGSDKVKLTATTADETDYIPLSKGTTGAQALYTDSNLTYNPANNVIGANVSGNAAFATNATHANAANKVAFTDRDSSNDTDYIAFVDSHAAGDKALFTDQNLTYNSSTNQIGANISGNAAFATSATHANAANKVAFTSRDSSNNTDYIAFVDGHDDGDKALFTDSSLTYNSSTNYLNANVPYANNAGTLDGSSKSSDSNANSIVQRNGSNDINTRLFRSSYGNQNTISGAMAFRVNSGNDNYIRFCSNTGSIRTFLNVPTRTGGNASGTWGINVNGNAAYANRAGHVVGGICKYYIKYVTTQRYYPSSTNIHLYDMDFNYAAERSNSTLVIQYSFFYECHQDRAFVTYVNNSYYPYNMSNTKYGVAISTYDHDENDTPQTTTFIVHYAPGTTSNRTYKIYSRSIRNASQRFALNRAFNAGGQYSEYGISYALLQEFAA
ncbi:hypothetical protein APZ24_gp069 [Ostreococcus lucimarinus virus 2]|uniref:hypothetical protein n=1 Tax=Ostreococcus lucimarinus virus 2 TaxID=1663208 RepID=UPI0006D0E283|nr:hypothetical protein APZ24_gp069 [Ostreococcus lucimarinus virus 2]ALI95432.1 hypothetical protein OlV2_069 [Ostreococcus lucimarinus virus 2]